MNVVRRPRRVYGYVVAGFLAVAGVLLQFVEDGFRTPSLQVAFDTFEAHQWGVGFILSAAFFVAFRDRVRSAAAPMGFMLVAWAAMLGWATLFESGASTTAWIWPACLATIVTLGIARADL